MTTLDEIEAKLAAIASSYFGMALPADAVEMRKGIRAEQDALANDESLEVEERLHAAFGPFDRVERPLRYLQLFVIGWPPFRDPAVAARVLVEQWNDFDAIPHELFVDLVFPHLSPELLKGAMNAEARKFLDDLPDPFLAWRGQDEGKPPGLSWATDPVTAEGFARGNRVTENPRPMVYHARIAKADVAFACADHSERGVILRRPPAKLKKTPGFDATIVKRKRGRPSQDELALREARAGYLRWLKAGPLPEEAPLIQQEWPERQPPPDKRPAWKQAEDNLAMALALALQKARQHPGGKQRFSKDESLEFVRERKEAVAKAFGVKPEKLNEERIYDLAVKTGRILNPRYLRGYIFDMAVKQGVMKPLIDKRKGPQKFVAKSRRGGDN
jgi:hypothetical protein